MAKDENNNIQQKTLTSFITIPLYYGNYGHIQDIFDGSFRCKDSMKCKV